MVEMVRRGKFRWIGGGRHRTDVTHVEGDIDVDAFVSHRISLEEVNHGFELMEAQDGIRSVIAFE